MTQILDNKCLTVLVLIETVGFANHLLTLAGAYYLLLNEKKNSPTMGLEKLYSFLVSYAVHLEMNPTLNIDAFIKVYEILCKMTGK